MRPPQAHISAFGQDTPVAGTPYPGIGTNSFSPQPGNLPVPFQQSSQGAGGLFGGSTGGSGGLGGALSKFNMNDIKNLVDRMGGIDGIMTTVGKAQKVVSTVQQMAPMLKLLMGSFGSKAAATDNDTFDEEDYSPTRKRRRRRKRSATRRRRSYRRQRSSVYTPTRRSRRRRR